MSGRILVSACLLGEPVRYDGRSVPFAHPLLARWQAQGRIVAVCPEMAGGLPAPRPPAEIVRPEARDLLLGRMRVLTRDGTDFSAAFRHGAEAVLALVRAEDVHVAILKEGSPSCGSTQIYDGSFTSRRIFGQGVTAALLRDAGVNVFSEQQIEDAARMLEIFASGKTG